MAQQIVDDIVGAPGASIKTGPHGRFGNIVDIRDPTGRGVRFSTGETGFKFEHFLEP